jgi:hydrogenase maturation protease
VTDSSLTLPRKIILGLGNLLYMDEGFGIHAMYALKSEITNPRDLEFIDGGVLGLNLLPLIEDCSHLLILDAINAGRPPGDIIELEKDLIPLYTRINLSEHQLGIQEVLALASFRNHLPEHIYLIGVQPEKFDPQVELSPSVATALPDVLERSRHILQGWGLLE